MGTESVRGKIERGEAIHASVLCPAKINLFLEVSARREDGYHEIDSIMQKVSLCDRLEMTFTKGEGIVITASDKTLPTGEKNLVYAAVAGYFERAGFSCRTEITLDKRIPISAGLAGGSTDAAGALGILDKTFHALDREALASLALSLGADVPFCLFRSQARCQGLGEVLSPCRGLPHCYLVIAKHRRESVSTKDAYRRIDSEAYDVKSSDTIAAALGTGELCQVIPQLFNRFEGIVLSEKPIAAKIKETMLENGAQGAMMSGSGPSVFGIFDSEEKALQAKSALRGLGAFAFVAHPWR
ncbi:MAG: 4-(cytidine 5'-diphospho)-2-C-methyl-D-erythritol kinase [Clostridia bacterium]|nr:4-(cytidine 5'-diphospho)-2-C-methyl-D-erythritol kinase [Clostridia bacterium]